MHTLLRYEYLLVRGSYKNGGRGSYKNWWGGLFLRGKTTSTTFCGSMWSVPFFSKKNRPSNICIPFPISSNYFCSG